MELFKKISKVDLSNLAVLDTSSGKMEDLAGQTLILDKKIVSKLKDKCVRITTDPNAPESKIGEDELLKEYSLDYRTLTKELRERYIDFTENKKYHETRKRIINENDSFIYQRRFDPKNPKSSVKNFYHPDIIKAFDEQYKKP